MGSVVSQRVESLADFDSVLAAFEIGACEQRIWSDMWADLLERFPGRFVVRVGSEVVASATHLDGACRKAEALGYSVGDEAHIRYVAPSDEILLL